MYFVAVSHNSSHLVMNQEEVSTMDSQHHSEMNSPESSNGVNSSGTPMVPRRPISRFADL